MNGSVITQLCVVSFELFERRSQQWVKDLGVLVPKKHISRSVGPTQPAPRAAISRCVVLCMECVSRKSRISANEISGRRENQLGTRAAAGVGSRGKNGHFCFSAAPLSRLFLSLPLNTFGRTECWWCSAAAFLCHSSLRRDLEGSTHYKQAAWAANAFIFLQPSKEKKS